MRNYQILKKAVLLCRKAVDSIFDIFYPSYCIRCELNLKKHERLLCDDCWNHIPKLDDDLEKTNDLARRYRQRIYFSNVLTVWKFDSHLQTIIHHLKYQNFKSLAKPVGNFMAEKIKRSGLIGDQSLLIPVPLHPTRVRERGYNQSDLLSNVIAEATGIEHNNNILTRIRYTRSQTALKAVERSANVKNAFKVSQREKIKQKTIILVDDVITTGATMNACAKELIKNGAKEVIVISAVHA